MNKGNCAGVFAMAAAALALAACSGADDGTEDVNAGSEEDLIAGSLRGVDTNGSTLDLGFARSRGVSFVGRYLSFDGSHPALTAAEVGRHRAAGMPLVAIWEIGQRRSMETGSLAKQRALEADLLHGRLRRDTGAVERQDEGHCHARRHHAR